MGTQITMDFNQQVDAQQLSIDDIEFPGSLNPDESIPLQALTQQMFGQPEAPNVFSMQFSYQVTPGATSKNSGLIPVEATNLELNEGQEINSDKSTLPLGLSQTIRYNQAFLRFLSLNQ